MTPSMFDADKSLVRGSIASMATGDSVDVIVPSFSRDQTLEDCSYMPRGEDAPPIGATCLVAFDDTGAAWVVAWN